jgi:hypothetical protein
MDNDNDNLYCAANLCLTWRLARGAQGYWLAHNNWPEGLDQHVFKIFSILATPQPNCLANIKQNNLNMPAVSRALKAWEDELGQYMDKEDPILTSVAPGPSSEQIQAKGKRKAVEDWEDAQVELDRERLHHHAQKLLYEARMPLAHQQMVLGQHDSSRPLQDQLNINRMKEKG